MNKKLLEEMNVQINKEIFSGYLYLAMAAHFEQVSLPGFAHWMKVQAGEELEHAMKFFEFQTCFPGEVIQICLIYFPGFIPKSTNSNIT